MDLMTVAKFTRVPQYARRAVLKLYKYEQYIFDIYFGVSTRGKSFTETDRFHADTENWPYLGCPWPAFSLVLRDLPHQGAFIDFGSGKGKALLIAGMVPFERVIGVEIDADLTMAAQHNVKRLGRRQRAGAIECVPASAVEWEVPDDASVIFMYNPFTGETFRQTIGNIFASYDRNPREMHLVYMLPWEHDWLLSTGRVQVERVGAEGWPRIPGWWDSEHVAVIYHVVGEDGAVPRCETTSRPFSAAERRALQHWKTTTAHSFQIELK